MELSILLVMFVISGLGIGLIVSGKAFKNKKLELLVYFLLAIEWCLFCFN